MSQRNNGAASRDPEETDQGRSRANLVALVFIIALFAGAYWLFKELEHYREVDNCIASGRRDCIPLTPSETRSP